MKRHWLSILLWGILSTVVSAQKYDVKRYSVNEGLPSGQIYDIEFTKDGYVWLASSYGLVKTDGKKVTVFDKKNGLREEIINDIFVDSDQNFWVGTNETGIGLLKNDTLIYPKFLDILKDKSINYIIESPSKEIWFGTYESGIYIWDAAKETLVSLNPSKELQSKTIWDIYFDDEGNVWIATHGGITVLTKDQEVVFQMDDKTGLNGSSAYQVFEDSKGKKWVPSNEGITIINPDFSYSNISKLDGKDLGYVFSIEEDRFGRIWIGTERKGIFWYTPDKVVHITKENGLSSNYIYRLVKDREGVIWVATEGNGVTIFKDTRFTNYDKDSEFGSNEVYGVLKDSKGILWFANENGLTKYDGKDFKTFQFPTSYKNEEVWDLEELQNGNILLLPYENPILQFDGKEFLDYPLKGIEKQNYISDIFPEDDGSLLLAGEGGVIIYKDGVKDTIKVKGESYWASYVNLILKDKSGIYWFGTEDGVVKFDGKTQVRFNSTKGVDGASIQSIKEDSLGNIWLGTNRGISVLTKSAKKDSIVDVRNFEIDKVYSGETIFIEFDRKGGVWQGTNAGLNYFDLHSWNSELAKNIHFPLQEFGKGIEFNGSASLVDNDGNLWFGTASKGLIKFDFMDEGSLPVSSEAPKVFIRSISANNNFLNAKSPSSPLGKTFLLRHDENNIDIQFGASNFKDPNRISYKYRLTGFNGDYSFVYDVNNIYYTTLEPGEYTFEVFAKSPNSDWSKSPATVSFRIQKPFWLEWWFLVIIGVVIISLFASIVKLRVEYFEKIKLSELVNEQTKELKDGLQEKEVLIKEIHHRVKNNLAVISGLLEMQSWSLENEEAKDALNESKLRVLAIGKIHENLYQNKNLGKIDFHSFLVELKDGIVSAMQTDNNIINIEIEVKADLIRVDQAIPCGLIINELVTNSYKHAFQDQEKKVIKISFTEDAENFYLSVHDNGKGIDENILSSDISTLGITLVNSLSLQLDSEIHIKNENGAHFELRIPKKNNSSS